MGTKMNIYVFAFVMGIAFFLTSCKKWKIKKFPERIVGVWEHHRVRGIDMVKYVNWVEIYRTDGTWSYWESCNEELNEGGLDRIIEEKDNECFFNETFCPNYANLLNEKLTF